MVCRMISIVARNEVRVILFSQLDVPQSMKYEIVSNVHNHVADTLFGVHKTFQTLKQRYWWPSMFKDVEHWCKSCVDCATKKSPRDTKRAPLLPLPVESIAVLGEVHGARASPLVAKKKGFS